MDIHSYKLCLLLFLLALPSNYAYYDRAEGLQTYIVHVDPSPDSNSIMTSDEQRESRYKSFLPFDSRLIYSYHSAISGFAARLTKQELAELEYKPGFLHAYPDRIVPLHTTHTQQFLGLHQHGHGLWNSSNFGQGVIIGMLDSGISPDHPSFRDNGAIGPPSNKWRGACEFGPSICSNKLIGARTFGWGLRAMQHKYSTARAMPPPFDTMGHGTHTASTAAGMFVDNASIEGQANGTAAGTAPHAHLAIYKVCTDRCALTDVMAGIDAAIHDGVDVLSISIGGSSMPYYQNGIAVGAFNAAAKGIFVSCAAGNSGPSLHSLSNEAPWVLTVGASSVDRRIRSTVTLGNGKQLDGESVQKPEDYSTPSLPLVYPGTVCTPGSLSGVDVRGKIVVCESGKISGRIKGEVVKAAGGAGMVLANSEEEGYTIFSLEVQSLPQSTVSYVDGADIKSYIASADSNVPTASITFVGTEIGPQVLAPAVAYFSSRGPSQADPKILKPDIVGPGVNVLAASTSEVGTPGAKFKLMSGTSMATPHLSGVAALLKKMHPDWSPAAIKSAIMTTASNTANDGKPIVDQNRNPADFFAVGAGHVDPLAASNPGLVYDIDARDYIGYLCGIGYSDIQASIVAQSRVRCSDYASGSELNYPSFVVSARAGESVTVTRTVTNVGAADSTYTADVVEPEVANVTVEPERLSFSSVGEKKQFSVTFVGKGLGGGGAEYYEGYLTWVSSDGGKVRSPMMVAVDAGGEDWQSM